MANRGSESPGFSRGGAVNIKHLPANMDARTGEEKARALLLADAQIINEWRRRVAANEERRRIERIKNKWRAV